MTLEEYKALLKKNGGIHGLVHSPVKSKYKNKRTTVDGINFMSKGEAERYLELKLLKSRGMITDLTLQPKFTFPCGVSYIADFQYYINGKLVVEDFKGFRNETYRKKLKMFKHHYPDVEFRETKKSTK